MSDEVFTLGEPKSSGGDDGENREFTIIPEDTVLEAELLEMNRKLMPYKNDDGDDVYKVEFTFRVVEDGEYKNRRVWGNTSTAFVNHPDCRLYSWVKALLGVEDLPGGFAFRPKDLLGSKARVVIGIRKYTPRNSTEEKAVNFVSELAPSRALVRAAAPAPAPAPAPVPASATDEEPF